MIRVEIRAEHLVGQVAPVGGHEVFGLDGADGHHVFVGAGVAHHAHALHRQQHGEGLRDVSRYSPAALISSTTIASASRSVSSRGLVTSPRQRTARPGPGERVPPDDLLGQARAARPSWRTSSLNRSRSGSISSNSRSSGRPPTLWCSLIVAAGPSAAAAALDHVGIERALGEELRPFDLGRLVGKAVDEGVADPPPLLLRVGDAGEHLEKPVLGLDHVQVGL